MKCDRVLRGGAWNNNANNARSASRNNNTPDNANNNIGFRCARGIRKAAGSPVGLGRARWFTDCRGVPVESPPDASSFPAADAGERRRTRREDW